MSAAESHAADLKRRMELYLADIDNPRPPMNEVLERRAPVYPFARLYAREESHASSDNGSDTDSDGDLESIDSNDEQSIDSCSASYCGSHDALSRWDAEESRDCDSLLAEADEEGDCSPLRSASRKESPELNERESSCSKSLEWNVEDTSMQEASEANNSVETDSDNESATSAQRLTADFLALHLQAGEKEREESTVGEKRLNRYHMNFKLGSYNNWIGGVYHPMWLTSASTAGTKRGTTSHSEVTTCPFIRVSAQCLDLETPRTLPIAERRIAKLKRESYRAQRVWSGRRLSNGNLRSAQTFPSESRDLGYDSGMEGGIVRIEQGEISERKRSRRS